MFPKKLIDSMTSNVSSQGVVSVSSKYDSTNIYEGFRALDGDTKTSWTSGDGSSHTVTFIFNRPVVIESYQITSRQFNSSDLTAMIKSWEFQISTDGVNFTTIDTKNDVIWDASGQEISFPLTKQHLAKGIRLKINKNNGFPNGIVTLGDFNVTGYLYTKKSILKNNTTGKYYTIDLLMNILVQLPDSSNSTILEKGIASGTVVDVDGIANFQQTLGMPYTVVTYVLDTTLPQKISIEYLHSERKLATSPEVLLLGVETIDSIVANSTSSPLTAISFDNGSSWISYDNGIWITVENAHQGMSIATLNSIPPEALTQIRGEANYIKFQHSFGNSDEISSFKMYVDFKGSNGILDTAYYSFDYSGGQLEVTLKKQGNYSIVYTDVDI